MLRLHSVHYLILMGLAGFVTPSAIAQLQQPHDGDLTVVVTPTAPPAPPAKVTASIDVFKSCAFPTGATLLKPGTKNSVTSAKKITLALASKLSAGGSVCAVETFAGAGAPGAITFPSMAVVSAATKVAIGAAAAGDKSVSVTPIAPVAPHTASLDLYATCPAPGAAPVGTALNDPTSANDVDSSGSVVTLQLLAPLKKGDQFCAVESYSGAPAKKADISAVVTAGDTTAAAAKITPVIQCNKGLKAPNVNDTPYSDCDLSFSLIGGVEQSAQSSLTSETTPFLRVFTRASLSDTSPINIWGLVRVLGAPTTSSTQGVISVVTDPSGNLTPQTFSTIGTSIDYMVGAEVVLSPAKAYTVSLIAGFGGTTPLQANTLSLAYQAPAFGTVECNQLYTRFSNQFGSDNIALGANSGASANAATATCLVNKNSPTSAGATTFTPVTTIGFSNQDRTSFLGKDLIGFRTIDRFLGPGNKACGTADPTNQVGVGPCARGIVDWTFGQDASVTGGQMRNYIFKVDGVHPLPVASVKFIYLFGSASIRLSRNTNYAPLILQSAAVSTLTGTGSSAIPNTSAVVLSLVQPNRDFYRFGVGVDLNQIFTKLFTAVSKPAAAAPTTP